MCVRGQRHSTPVGPCNEHGPIKAISSDFGDRLTMHSMELKKMLNWTSYAKISSTGSSYDPAQDLPTSIGLTDAQNLFK